MINKNVTYNIVQGESLLSIEAPEGLTAAELQQRIFAAGGNIIISDAAYDAVVITQKSAVTDYANLAAWAKTGTAAEAETFINSQVWSGQSVTQVEAWIDTNITNITTANIAQINARLLSIRQALKLAAGAIINMRGLFILTAKLLIYIRDLVIRFRGG